MSNSEICLTNLSGEWDAAEFCSYKLRLMEEHELYANKMGLVDNMIKNYTKAMAVRHIGELNHFQHFIEYRNVRCGMIEYKLDVSDIDDQNILYIKSMYVDKGFRRKGIAKTIIKNLIEQNEELRIELNCWYGLPANQLYKSIGMREVTTRYVMIN